MNYTPLTSPSPLLLGTSQLWENVIIIIIMCIVSFSVLGNLIAVLSILTSDFRSSINGHLLINQAVADIGFLVVSMFILVVKNGYVTEDLDSIITFLVLIWLCVIGAGAHSMAIVSFNLFIAICHYAKYKSMITKKRLHIVMLGSWIINAMFILQIFLDDKFMYYNHTYKKVMSNYSPGVIWIGILIIINCPIIPFVTTTVCFVHILRHTRRVLPTSLNASSINRFRLSKIILANIALFSSTYVLLLVSQLFQANFVIAVSSFIHFVYHLTKLPLLLIFYPPLRQRLSMCKCRRRSTPQIVQTQVLADNTASTRHFQITLHSGITSVEGHLGN